MNRFLSWLLILIFLIAFANPNAAVVTRAGEDTRPSEVNSSLYVNSTADTQANDGACTLREAILNANGDNQSGSTDCTSGSGTDSIYFSLASPATIVLGSALPAIAGTLTIQGPGANMLTVSGNGSVRIFNINSGAALTLKGLTLSNGNGANGGAITNFGSLNVTTSVFANNVSGASSGAIYNGGGTLDVRTSTFSGNQATSAGGAIGNYGGTASVTNSTFSGNSVTPGSWGGGAIYNRLATIGIQNGSDTLPAGDASSNLAPESPANPQAGKLVVTASTFLGNTSPANAGAIGNGGSGETGGALTILNSVFGGNLVGSASVNCHNEVGTLTDGGYNLEDADTCGFSGTSLKNTDPIFIGLGLYGGQTPTVPVRADSPAINRFPSGVNGCGATLSTDQRGVVRPQGGACDVGAYESDQQSAPSFVVNQTGDANGLCTISACTLRQAIYTVQLYPPGSGFTISFNLSYPNTIFLGSTLPPIASTLTIQGPGANKLSVSGNNSVRILNVNPSANLTLNGLALANGMGGNGGAIYNQGIVNVANSVFINNGSFASSGAIFNYGGTLDVKSSTFWKNQSITAGGAIGNYGGAATVTNSTFYGNSTSYAGGGAIYFRVSMLRTQTGMDTLLATDAANGPLSIPAGFAGPSVVMLVVTASTFSSNTATGGAGAIGNGYSGGEMGGALTIQNSLLAGSLVGGLSVNCVNNGGALNDGGYNLEDADTCGFSGTSHKNTNPLIWGLGNNGGSTPTIALRNTSPAIDYIPNGVNGCGTTWTTDQRGVIRPVDGNHDGTAACDVGAYEYNGWKYRLPIIRRDH